MDDATEGFTTNPPPTRADVASVLAFPGLKTNPFGSFCLFYHSLKASSTGEWTWEEK